MYDCAIVGGGIVGLATALSLCERQPWLKIVLLEKERDVALHQTGRNSGVIHSGLYYAPGSKKANYARAGNISLVEFCRKHGIRHEICGKLVVACSASELPQLEKLYRRGIDNGLEVRRLTAEAVLEIEPKVVCPAGLLVPSTGIVNYRSVCAKMLELIVAQGVEVRRGGEVLAMRLGDMANVLETSTGSVASRFVVTCGGLQSDRLARMAGVEPGANIVPFRGEYYELKPERRCLVKGLVYPVPNPLFPFLGVHFTRMLDGAVHAGPSAVLALKREGYGKTDVSCRDLCEILAFPGFWRMAGRHAKEGFREMYRSFSKQAFVRSLQRMIPEVCAEDLVESDSGVRAQALKRDGDFVDDFLIVQGRHSIHVCNAPSPAATASLEIGKAVAECVPVRRGGGKL